MSPMTSRLRSSTTAAICLRVASNTPRLAITRDFDVDESQQPCGVRDGVERRVPGPLQAGIALAALLVGSGCGRPQVVHVGHTAIAMLVDASEAAIAVDSLEGLGDSRRATTRKQACKLRRVNGVAFAASGPIGYRTTATVDKPDFEVMDIAAGFLRGEGALEERLNRLDSAFVPIFSRALNDPRRPRGLLAPKLEQVIEIFFVARHAGRVEVSTRAYLPVMRPDGGIDITFYKRACVLPTCPPIDGAVFAGQKEAMQRALDSVRRRTDLALPLRAELLIQAQITATDETVGPPVDIVRARQAQGVTWFARKAGCPADQQ